MDQLKETNAWLGNRPALDRILQEQGYWFFRDVLDHDAVADLRKKCQATLAGWGVSDPDGEEPLWNGSSLDGIASGLQNMNAKVPELREGRAWEEFVHHPRINAFFESILGSPLEWLKISDYYRIVPPTQDIPDDPYIGRHQDGGGLMGLDCVICWIPLHSIDEKVGGLAVSTGSYNGQLHPDRWFDPDLVKPDGWARAEYHAGDVLMFGRESSGVPDAVHQAADARLFIPMQPGLRSINVAMAAAMALGEAMRQTNGLPNE